jgi:hypothetical protein
MLARSRAKMSAVLLFEPAVGKALGVRKITFAIQRGGVEMRLS